MKTLLFGLFFLGFANLNFSQNNIPFDLEFNKIINNFLDDDNVVVSVNKNYLDAVIKSNSPVRAASLEKKAASFDVTQMALYDINQTRDTYTVVFENKSPSGDIGKITTTYNNDGKILSSSGVFQNIKMPLILRNTIFLEYPGWTVEHNKYQVIYSTNKNTKKLYKLSLKKNNKRKTVKVDLNGKSI